MDQVTDATQIAEPVAEYLIGEPETETPADSRPWLFKPGQSGNPAGRPKRGQTAPERLRVELDRRAPKIIDGLLTKAEKGDTRAFVAAMSYSYGVPATKLIVEQADSPAADLLLAMLAAKGATPALSAPSEQIIDAAPLIDATDT